eukprot:2582180-Pyramimonas_sp.AAC.1
MGHGPVSSEAGTRQARPRRIPERRSQTSRPHHRAPPPRRRKTRHAPARRKRSDALLPGTRRRASTIPDPLEL